MATFIIFCVLSFLTGIVLINIRRSEIDFGESFFERKPSGAAYFTSIGGAVVNAMLFLCAVYDFPGGMIVVGILVLWVLITSGINGLGPVGCYIFFLALPMIPFQHWEEHPYQPFRKGDSWVLRQPATYWLTGRNEAEGTDTFSISIISRRGQVFNKPLYATVKGLKDSAGRLHIPRVCTYADGFTDCRVEPYRGSACSVEVFRLRRPDGTVKRLDIEGKDTASPDYTPPAYNDDPNYQVTD